MIYTMGGSSMYYGVVTSAVCHSSMHIYGKCVYIDRSLINNLRGDNQPTEKLVSGRVIFDERSSHEDHGFVFLGSQSPKTQKLTP